MKKIFNIVTNVFVVVFVLVLAVACTSKDDLEGTGTYTNSISVLAQNVCFDAPASEGTIYFSAPSSATVTSTSDWCTTTLNGDVIGVEVTQNNDRESRSCNIIIKCGADSAKVNVVQNGYIFQLSAGSAVTTNNDAAQTMSFDFESNLNFTLTPSADWFTAEIKDGKMNIAITENATGHVRKGYLYYVSGNIKDSLVVTQYDFDKDIAGDAYLYYYNASGKLYRTAISLSESSYSMPAYAKYGDWNIPYTFDADNLSFNFTNAQNCGMYSNTYYVGDCMFNATAGYVTYYQGCSWDAPIEYYPEDGIMEADMTDNGSWTYPFEGFYLRAFNSTTFNSTTNKGNLLTFISPFIVRFDPTLSAKAKIPARYQNAEEVTEANFDKLLDD